MEDSPLGLDKWLMAMWLVASNRNGISSWELHRALGITQKSAWFLLHRIRLAMQDEGHGGKLGGEVEVDETFIGGRARNMHKDRRERAMQGLTGGAVGKTAIQGILERGGKVRTEVVENTRKETVVPNVLKHVEKGSAIYSDDAGAYDGLQSDYEHEVINHAITYVRGNVHTNGMENFWSLLKRSLKGTYVYLLSPFTCSGTSMSRRSASTIGCR